MVEILNSHHRAALDYGPILRALTQLSADHMLPLQFDTNKEALRARDRLRKYFQVNDIEMSTIRRGNRVYILPPYPEDPNLSTQKRAEA